MKTGNNINNRDLDQLLIRAFLDADVTTSLNNKLTDSIAETVLVKPRPLLFSSTIILAAATIVAALSVLFVQVLRNDKNSSLSFNKKQNDMSIKLNSTVKEKVNGNNSIQDTENPKNIQTQTQVKDTTALKISKIMNPDPVTLLSDPIIRQSKPQQEYQDDERLPVLTEKEIKANEKEKKKMTRSAIKKEKKKYVPVSYNNSILYVQTAEVTNLEYRTFLFDLLIQGKKDEFLKAKPKQSLWLNAAGTKKFNYLKDDYFTDKQFDNYPVVNISSEGAEMYCRWLTELISKESETYICHLPTNDEWTFAASGNLGGSYPWGTDSIQNTKNRFLANFCIQKMPEKFKQPIAYPTPINLNSYTSAGMALNNDSIATAQVYTYNPNSFGLYCMSGNAAEMVKTKDSLIKCKGGSWNSNFEQLKINSEEDCDTPSPTTGFRVILKKQN